MRIECFQGDVVFGRPIENAEVAERHLRESTAHLVVFPEAFLTGYCVDSQESACAIAIGRDDSTIERIRAACDAEDRLAVVGFAECEGDRLFNSAALFEPGRPPRFYRKTHLPYLGYDRFAVPGDALPLWDTRLGRIGILICFDLRFPEAARVLALQGADLLVLPTNWPEGAVVSAEHIAISRAAENRIFVATCNRVGSENGFRFIGKSKIVDPTGRVLASADGEASVLSAELDFSLARQKRTVTIPGAYETEVFAPRLIEAYGPLIERREPPEVCYP